MITYIITKNKMRMSNILILITLLISCNNNGLENTHSKAKEKVIIDRNIIEKQNITNDKFQSIDEKELDNIAKKLLNEENVTVDFGSPIEIVYQQKYQRYLIIYRPSEKIILGEPPRYILVNAKTKIAERVPFDMHFSEDKKEVIGINNFKLIDENEAINIAKEFLKSRKRTDWDNFDKVIFQSSYHRYLILYKTPKNIEFEGGSRGVFVDSFTKEAFFLPQM